MTTDRELLTESLQDMEDVLLAVQGVSNRRNLTEKGVIVLMARAIWCILTHAIRILDKERRKNNG